MKYWEIMADNLSKQGWSWGYSGHSDATARITFVVDAHRDNGKGFIVRSDELLTAFWNLKRRREGPLGRENHQDHSKQKVRRLMAR